MRTMEISMPVLGVPLFCTWRAGLRRQHRRSVWLSCKPPACGPEYLRLGLLGAGSPRPPKISFRLSCNTFVNENLNVRHVQAQFGDHARPLHPPEIRTRLKPCALSLGSRTLQATPDAQRIRVYDHEAADTPVEERGPQGAPLICVVAFHSGLVVKKQVFAKGYLQGLNRLSTHVKEAYF